MENDHDWHGYGRRLDFHALGFIVKVQGSWTDGSSGEITAHAYTDGGIVQRYEVRNDQGVLCFRSSAGPHRPVEASAQVTKSDDRGF